MPILDWGQGRGRYKMAQSSEELTQVQVEQSRIDFEQNLMLDVQQFNLQDDQVKIAAKSDTVAAKMFEVTKQRFLIGRIDVLELNNADTKKDQNKRSYIQALNNYWTYFYNMRALTLLRFYKHASRLKPTTISLLNNDINAYLTTAGTCRQFCFYIICFKKIKLYICASYYLSESYTNINFKRGYRCRTKD
ncbi:MAG: TolC family protein [Marinilabiliales bacterium]|nr:TolC family protein [Marinilabiliales bacterium]